MKKVNLHSAICKSLVVIIASLFVTVLNAQNEEKTPLPQFLFPKFSKSIVKMKAGNVYSASIDYNMVDQEMIFEQKGQYLALLNPELIDTVFIQNRAFIPVEKAFYEVVAKGNNPVFIQHRSKYAPVGTTTAYGMTSQTNGPASVRTINAGTQVRQLDVPDGVTLSPATVNWVRKNNEMIKFINERQFLKIFPEKEAELKAFIKKEKIDLKVREDVLKLGVYCNEIIK
jgi:hypothetical protein